MDTTKTRLCDTAIRLFNEKGYDSVSLREIAEAAGTTIGNLTYHFGQKELLLEAVAWRYQNDFFPKFNPLTSARYQLEDVIITFFKAQENEEQAPVYYRNVSEFAKSSPTLEQRNKEFRKSLYDYYFASFLLFKQEGVFRIHVTIEQIEILAYSVVFFASLWIQNASPYYDELLPHIPLADALCNLLQPYLADDYMAEYNDLFVKYRKN